MENNLPILTTDQTSHSTMISQPWLRILRVVWVILAILAVAILIASIPGYILHLQGESYTTEIIPDSGQLLVMDQPEIINARILKYLIGD